MNRFIKKEMFLGANTGNPHNFGYEGTESDLRENHNLTKLYLLKGKNGNGKNTLMNTVANSFPNNEKDIYLCSGDSISTDAVIINSEHGNWGLVDATAPHSVEPQDNGIDQVVDLAQFINPRKVTATDEEIEHLAQQRLSFYSQSNKYLALVQTAYNNLKNVDPREVQKLYRPIYDMLRDMGLAPIEQNIEAFVRSVTSEGIKDLSTGWTTPDKTHYVDAPEEVASEVFKKLKGFGGYTFRHYLKPDQLLEGSAIGGHLFKVAPDRQTKLNQSAMESAIEALQGADRDTHNLLENVFKPAVDFKGVNNAAQQIIKAHEH